MKLHRNKLSTYVAMRRRVSLPFLGAERLLALPIDGEPARGGSSHRERWLLGGRRDLRNVIALNDGVGDYARGLLLKRGLAVAFQVGAQILHLCLSL